MKSAAGGACAHTASSRTPSTVMGRSVRTAVTCLRPSSDGIARGCEYAIVAKRRTTTAPKERTGQECIAIVYAVPLTNLNASKNSGGACQFFLDACEPLARRRIVREPQPGDAIRAHEDRGAMEDLE